MAVPDTLQTIAEISIAFAGFTGLVVALRRNVGPLSAVQKYRLQILLSLAFGAMFLSLLPDLLQHFAVPDKKIWPVACTALILYSGIFLFWWIRSSREIRHSHATLFNWFAFTRMATGHVLIIVLQLVVIAALFEDIGAAAYISGMIWYLLHAAQQFSRMLFIQAD